MDRSQPAPSLPADVQSARAFFSWFHGIRPRATSSAFARGRFGTGESTYERTLSALDDRIEPVILDIGCGDGYLLKQARLRWPPARLVGVDLVPRAAAGPLALVRATLYRADAAALPLHDAGVNLVTMHLTLPFFADPRAVLAEVVRVLRPGGIVSVIVTTPAATPNVHRLFVDEVRRLAAAGGDKALNLKNGWTGSADRLKELFADADMVDVRIHADELDLDGSATEVWEVLANMYDWPLLADAARDELMEACERHLASGAIVPCRIGIWHLTARSRADA